MWERSHWDGVPIADVYGEGACWALPWKSGEEVGVRAFSGVVVVVVVVGVGLEDGIVVALVVVVVVVVVVIVRTSAGPVHNVYRGD